MSEAPLYRPHDEAPARVHLRPSKGRTAFSGGASHAFELVSRGDFVTGCLALPDTATDQPAPLVLVAHGTGESAEAASLDFAADWVGHGFAVAAIDLPLHGRRTSPKLSARLVDGLRAQSGGKPLDLDTRALVEEFTRQSISDLIRTLDALSGLPEIDDARLALVGQGIGSRLCAYVLAHDPRPRAGVFAGGIGTLDDPAFDPGRYLAERAPSERCPLLVMALAEDPEVSTAAATRFFEGLAEPRSFAAITADADAPSTLSPDASQRIRAFLTESR